jgi:membrane fusion protein (multidrug efflux system)
MQTRFIFALALASLTAAAGCGIRPSKAEAQRRETDPAVSVATAPVATRQLPRTVTLTGTLTANRESGVAADVMGKVAATFVERGSRVAKGAPLVRLDRRQAALMAEEARSQAAAAETQRALAQADCGRADKLYAQGAINEAEHDRVRTQCQATTFAASAADARQQLAGKTLGDLVVKAPFAGVVADRFVTAGEYVRPESKVATVVQLDPLRLELSVPENALAKLGVGAEVRFRVAAFPEETFAGRVRFVGASVRRATRDLLVEAVVANKGERLRPGMFAVAEVELGAVELPVVPRGALRTDERAGTDRVFVVDAGRLQERLVHVGAPAGDAVAILAGLKAGERIVLSPAANLRDGLRVLQ